MKKKLDPLLHNELRLAIISLLVSLESAEFTFIQEKTEASAGNLSAQLSKLKESGYLTLQKRFKDNYPQTICKITPEGISAFEQYVKAIQDYLNTGKP